MRQRVVFIVETVGGGVRTHVLQLLKNLDPERYELTLIYGERYDHVFESQREELAKHVTLILDSNLVRSAGLRASWKAEFCDESPVEAFVRRFLTSDSS